MSKSQRDKSIVTHFQFAIFQTMAVVAVFVGVLLGCSGTAAGQSASSGLTKAQLDHALYPIKVDGKWGLIDSSGTVVVKPTYDAFSSVTVDKQQYTPVMTAKLYAVEKGGLWGFVNRSGVEVVPPQYDSVGNFNDGMASVGKNGKRGYVSAEGMVVVPPRYTEADDFVNGTGVVGEKDSSGVELGGLINTKGQVIIPLGYHGIMPATRSGLVVAVKGKQFTLLDTHDKAVFPQTYQVIGQPLGSAVPVENNGKWGIVSTSGKTLLPIEYRYVGALPPDYFVIQTQNKEIGFTDLHGHVLVPPKYNGIAFASANSIAVLLGQKWGIISRDGKILLPFEYRYIWNLSDGIARISKSGKVGFVSKNGNVLVAPKYDAAADFHDGMAIVKLQGKLGAINTDGKEIVPPTYDWMSEFSSGLACVQENGKVGAINRNGDFVVQPTYDSVNLKVAVPPAKAAWEQIIPPLKPQPQCYIGQLAEFGSKVGNTTYDYYVNTKGKVVWQTKTIAPSKYTATITILPAAMPLLGTLSVDLNGNSYAVTTESLIHNDQPSFVNRTDFRTISVSDLRGSWTISVQLNQEANYLSTVSIDIVDASGKTVLTEQASGAYGVATASSAEIGQ